MFSEIQENQATKTKEVTLPGQRIPRQPRLKKNKKKKTEPFSNNLWEHLLCAFRKSFLALSRFFVRRNKAKFICLFKVSRSLPSTHPNKIPTLKDRSWQLTLLLTQTPNCTPKCQRDDSCIHCRYTQRPSCAGHEKKGN